MTQNDLFSIEGRPSLLRSFAETSLRIPWAISMPRRRGLDCAALGWKTAERRVGEQVTGERRYYILSLAGNTQAFGRAVQSHWGIENGLALGARPCLSSRCQPHAQGPQPAKLCDLTAYGPQPAQTGTDGHVWHQSQAKHPQAGVKTTCAKPSPLHIEMRLPCLYMWQITTRSLQPLPLTCPRTRGLRTELGSRNAMSHPLTR